MLESKEIHQAHPPILYYSGASHRGSGSPQSNTLWRIQLFGWYITRHEAIHSDHATTKCDNLVLYSEYVSQCCSAWLNLQS